MEGSMRLTCPTAILVALYCLAAGVAHADAPPNFDMDHPGFEAFRFYCAVCHGLEGNGLGPSAPALVTPPSDLTKLGAKYGTPLPRKRLAAFIDGRNIPLAHGTREMPIWGKQLYEEAPPETPGLEEARLDTILLILDYLESIQRPASANPPEAK